MSSPECAGILVEVCRLGDERCLPVVMLNAVMACETPGSEACVGVVDALVRTGDGEALRKVLELERVSAAGGVLRFDEAVLGTTMQELCASRPVLPGCERLVTVLAEKGVPAASQWRRRERLRKVVERGVLGSAGERQGAIAELRSAGAEVIPALLGLIGEGRLSTAEQELVRDCIDTFGAAGTKRLVDAMKQGELQIGLAAAAQGWDPAAHEREDARRAADEEAVRTVYLDEAGESVGKSIRVELKDGSEREGLLTKVDDEHLYLQLSVGSGSVGYTVRRADVAKIRF